MRSRTTLNLPAWYEEGLATYLGNLQVDEGGVVTVGRGPHALLRFLVKQPQTRFERVVDGRFRLGGQHHELSHPYALAWGVVRFLHHAKRPDGSRYAKDLGAMLAAIDEGATSAEALRELGIAIADLAGLMRAYYAAEGTGAGDRLPLRDRRIPAANAEARVLGRHRKSASAGRGGGPPTSGQGRPRSTTPFSPASRAMSLRWSDAPR